MISTHRSRERFVAAPPRCPPLPPPPPFSRRSMRSDISSLPSLWSLSDSSSCAPCPYGIGSPRLSRRRFDVRERVLPLGRLADGPLVSSTMASGTDGESSVRALLLGSI